MMGLLISKKTTLLIIVCLTRKVLVRTLCAACALAKDRPRLRSRVGHGLDWIIGFGWVRIFRELYGLDRLGGMTVVPFFFN